MSAVFMASLRTRFVRAFDDGMVWEWKVMNAPRSARGIVSAKSGCWCAVRLEMAPCDKSCDTTRRVRYCTRD